MTINAVNHIYCVTNAGFELNCYSTWSRRTSAKIHSSYSLWCRYQHV